MQRPRCAGRASLGEPVLPKDSFLARDYEEVKTTRRSVFRQLDLPSRLFLVGAVLLFGFVATLRLDVSRRATAEEVIKPTASFDLTERTTEEEVLIGRSDESGYGDEMPPQLENKPDVHLRGTAFTGASEGTTLQLLHLSGESTDASEGMTLQLLHVSGTESTDSNEGTIHIATAEASETTDVGKLSPDPLSQVHPEVNVWNKRSSDLAEQIAVTEGSASRIDDELPAESPSNELKDVPVMEAKGDQEHEYHIVFSTGCNPYQHWQSYVFFHQAMVVQQPGNITRIVSGCNEEEERICRLNFEKEIAPMRPDRSFHIHFTPNYELISNKPPSFLYFNKPFGMRHFMQEVLGFPDKPLNEKTIVILMDPDQLILQPSSGTKIPRGEGVTNDSRIELEPLARNVLQGKPIGHMFALGTVWRSSYNLTKVMPPASAERVVNMTDEEFQKFVVGPPYMATARDMWALVDWWCKIVVPLHGLSDFFLVEMFAYSLAAAHLDLPHQVSSTTMISDVVAETGKEGWDFLDQIVPEDDFCHQSVDESQLPYILHYCQQYGLHPFYLWKGRLYKEFIFSCEQPLLAEPVISRAMIEAHNGSMTLFEGATGNYQPHQVKRGAFVVCLLTKAINAAATYFKQSQCAGQSPNMNKTFMLVPS